MVLSRRGADDSIQEEATVMKNNPTPLELASLSDEGRANGVLTLPGAAALEDRGRKHR